MLETVVTFLHIAPLCVIGMIALRQLFGRLSGERADSMKSSIAMLILSSIGIISGSFQHYHGMPLLDPCFGYAATLIYVALKIAQSKVASVKK